MKVKSMDEDFESIMICAIRYALGRRTYIVGTVCGFVKSRLPEISDKSLYVIERDIREHGHIGNDAYGDLMDFREWMALLEAVMKEMNKRGVKSNDR
jgi:hypothetical protein